MIKSIIFDWSGVLSDDWEAVFETTNDVLEIHGYPRLSMERFRELYELPWENFYKKQGYKIDMDYEYKLWDEIFPKYYPKIKALPHGKQVLKWLKKKSIKTIVFSSHNKKLVNEEIKNYGYSELIDDAEGSIPDKRKRIEELVNKHEIERKSTLYVGDMCHDIETARLAGIKSVAVLSGYDSREKLEKEKPDYIIKGVGELPTLIEKIEANEDG